MHFPLQLLTVLIAGSLGFEPGQVFYTPWFFLAYLLTVFVLARLVFLGFERPVQIALRRALIQPATVPAPRPA